MDQTRFARRRDRLRKAMRKGSVTALLVSKPVHVEYLTGFGGGDSYLLLDRQREILISDRRFEIEIGEDCPGLEAYLRKPSEKMDAAVGKIAKQLGIHSAACEGAHLSVANYELIRAAQPAVEWRTTTGLVEALRQVKDRREITLIRKAIRQAEKAFQQFQSWLHEDHSEWELAHRLEMLLREEGAAGSSFSPIVAVGPRSALPHARPTEARLGSGGWVLIDWGARSDSYVSDLTRVVPTRKFTAKFERVYRTVLAAQRAAIAMLRPGVLAEEVDRAARRVITEAGFGKAFGHSVGHGIGMEVHEGPGLREGATIPLEPGMVVTVEPGIYLEGWGGVRIEDDVLITPDGHDVLSSLPKELDDLS